MVAKMARVDQDIGIKGGEVYNPVRFVPDVVLLLLCEQWEIGTCTFWCVYFFCFCGGVRGVRDDDSKTCSCTHRIGRIGSIKCKVRERKRAPSAPREIREFFFSPLHFRTIPHHKRLRQQPLVFFLQHPPIFHGSQTGPCFVFFFVPFFSLSTSPRNAACPHLPRA